MLVPTPLNLDFNHIAPPPLGIERGIGAVGTGFIMRDVQLKAYATAGFNVIGITSRNTEVASQIAVQYKLPKRYANLKQMLADPEIEILDIALPPDRQLDVIRQVTREGRFVKGILAQKPLAVHYDQALEIVRLCADRGLPLAVNQNMRYDHSMRALKTVLDRGYLGTPVLATIEMRAVPHWQSWLQDYQRLTFLNMSVHHVDVFRFLFGDPEATFLSARKDPRTGLSA